MNDLTWKPIPDPLPEGARDGHYWRRTQRRDGTWQEPEITFVTAADVADYRRMKPAESPYQWAGPVLPPPLPEEAP